MSRPAIRVEGLWKEFSIGGPSANRTFREALTDSVKSPLRRLAGHERDAQTRFWALQDVSFDVAPGEVVGVIGRNGAGKSTLLKILSRITAPTRGRIEISGRIASLLEVGTGFHPELTGRENIRLNGAILGMSGAEISRKFDEIVDFSGVEKFIDTPVKRYSSGMQVRLAFAVAAHLEPEILVVDEVLAVGDAEFQKKCLGKMRDLTREGGRTILFVSHNLAAVTALCSSGVYLERGSIVMTGQIDGIIRRYASSHDANNQYQRSAPAASDATLMAASLSYQTATNSRESSVIADVEILAKRPLQTGLCLRWKDALGGVVGFASVGFTDFASLLSLEPGVNRLRLRMPSPRLAEGSYIVSIDVIHTGFAAFDRVEDCIALDIEPSGGEVGVMPLRQAWNCGGVYFPFELVQAEVVQSAKAS